MDIMEARNIVEKHLSHDRFEHTLRVTETAVSLAERFHIDLRKVELAAMLHDYAKCMPKQQLKELIMTLGLPKVLLQFHHEVWHGPVAAKIFEHDFNITDEEILNAIYYHTTGRAKMSDVELAVFVADYIEPGRSFPGVDIAREKSENDLSDAARFALKNTIQFLLNKDATIFPDTFHAYNDLTLKLGVNVD